MAAPSPPPAPKVFTKRKARPPAQAEGTFATRGDKLWYKPWGDAAAEPVMHGNLPNSLIKDMHEVSREEDDFGNFFTELAQNADTLGLRVERATYTYVGVVGEAPIYEHMTYGAPARKTKRKSADSVPRPRPRPRPRPSTGTTPASPTRSGTPSGSRPLAR